MRVIFQSKPHLVLENIDSFSCFLSCFTKQLLGLYLWPPPPPPPVCHRWIGILTLYIRHRGRLDCAGGVLLSSYLIVLIILLAVIICTVSAIVGVSMRGNGAAFAVWHLVCITALSACNSHTILLTHLKRVQCSGFWYILRVVQPSPQSIC